MTETNRYENGKIYKLVSPHTDKIYIGSTCKKYLSQRLTKHKSHYKVWLKDNKNNLSSFTLLELGDVEIVLLESVNCNTKDELLKKEREYIEKYKDILVNKNIPSRTSKEYDEKYNKEYHILHKDKLNKKAKDYYENHKEELNEKYNCVCGKQSRICRKARHEKSKYHINFISNQ